MRHQGLHSTPGVMGAALEALEPRLCMTAPGSLTLPPSATVLSYAATESVVSADFDQDGLADVVASRGNTLSFHRGRADGTFGAAVVTTLPTEVGVLAVGRFDGDQRPDLASLARVRGIGTGYIGLLARTLYFDAGTLKFSVGARLRLGDAASAGGERRIGAGDFVSGWRDEIVAGIGSKVDIRLLKLPMRTELVQHDVLLQSNQAVLQAMTVARNLPGAAAGRSQVVSVIGESFSHTVTVTRVSSDTIGQHDTRSVQSFATGRYASVVTGDIDGDGDVDILLGGTNSSESGTIGEIVVLRGASGGVWGAAERILSKAPGVYFEHPSLQVDGLGDVNGDGRVDVLYHTVVTTVYRLTYTDFSPQIGVQDADGGFAGFATGRSISSGVLPSESYSRSLLVNSGTLGRPTLVQYSIQGLNYSVATTTKYGPAVSDVSVTYDGTPSGGLLKTGSAFATAYDIDPIRGGHVVRVEIFVDLDDGGMGAGDPLLCTLTTQDPTYWYQWSGRFTVPNEWAPGSYRMYARAIDDDGLESSWLLRPFQVYA